VIASSTGTGVPAAGWSQMKLARHRPASAALGHHRRSGALHVLQFLQSLRNVRLDRLDLISRTELKELGTGRGGSTCPGGIENASPAWTISS